MSHDETSPTLLIMAAGLGSRFGGVKQLATVGPEGEAILDLSIRDARAAGFGPVVLIVRSDIEDDVRAHLAAVHGDDSDFTFVRQDDFGPAREKPWGTLHAVLSARACLDRPFCVINADDYYGPKSFEQAASDLARSEPGRASNVAFRLGNTVPPSGMVTRGICAVSDGMLTGIVETNDCGRDDSGQLWAGGEQVEEDTFSSMNMWTFHPSVLDHLARRWEIFHTTSGDDPKAECLLPPEVGVLVDDGLLTVEVTSSPERWIGITNPEDLELVRAALAGR